jgi:hypothetical protein
MTITYRADKGFELSHDEMDANFADLDARTAMGWKDLVSPIAATPGSVAAPTLEAFQTAGTLQRKEYAFAIDDYVWLTPFHVLHDIKADGTSKAYLHVHWSTNGTQTNTVKWEFHVQRALRSTAAFGAPTVISVTGTPSGVAYTHEVTEVADVDALTLTQPDELILVSLKRVTNGGTNNTNLVYGLMVDMHYEAGQASTINKAAPFWG